MTCICPLGTLTTVSAQTIVDRFYDFRNGSIVPTNTDGKSDIVTEDLTIKVGTKNAYQYNDSTHGVLFKEGNSIEINVPGSVTISVGDCLYSGIDTLTLADTTGSYTQTVSAANGNYHNGSTIDFNYEGEETTLVLNITDKTYIPCIRVTNQKSGSEEEMPEQPEEKEEGLKAPVTDITTWYFDGIHPQSFRGNIQKQATYVENLYVDTTEGKFTARISANGYTPDQGDTQVGAGTKVHVPVATKANIYVITNSVADVAVNGTLLTRIGTVASTPALSALETTGNVYKYENISRKPEYVVLDFVGTGYLKGLFVEYADFAVPNVSAKTDVWDFSGNVIDDESINSHITSQTYEKVNRNTFTTIEDSKGVIYPVFSDGNGGTSNTVGKLTFGDLTLNYRYKDRLYTKYKEFSYSTKFNQYTKMIYPDGYQAQGGYFANGTSSEKHRNLEIANVEKGDKITLYMASSREVSSAYPNPADKLHFRYTGSEGSQDDTNVLTNKAGKFEFTANYNGTYKIYVEATNGSKPVISKVVRTKTTGVISGTLTTELLESFDDDDCGLVFISEKGEKYDAVLSNDGLSYYVVVPTGAEYEAILTDAKGYEVSEATRTVVAGLNTLHDLAIAPVEMYSIEGTIDGFTEEYEISNLGITLVAENYKESIALDVDLETMTFKGNIENGVNYTIKLIGVNDYVVDGNDKIIATEDMNLELMVTPAKLYNVTGAFTNIENAQEVSNLVFTNVEDGYRYAAQVTENGYVANLRSGSYLASAKVNGYSMNTIVKVNDCDTERDLLFIKDKLAAGSVAWESDIYVGYEDDSLAHNYATLNEALEIAYAMNPKSEAKRITIHIAPGTYREQVIVSTPYVSLVNDTEEEVLVTWYYGIGYEYYSADENGFYSVNAAYNKSEKNIASRWGCSVFVQASAKAFRAENIIFENSFNRYLTEEELVDGVKRSSRAESSIKVERTKELDVKSREATERAAAMVIEADQTEFKNCQFLSSQDTLYTAPKLTGYFLNCKIEGGVDYIFGYGDYVFDACELSFYGYSNKNAAGYITACRTPKTEGLGYLFNNCTVTGNSEQIVAPGYFGRPWGADATVTFLNTKLEYEGIIQPQGWYSMSGVAPEEANYHEFGTTVNGEAVDTSKRICGTVMDEKDALNINVTDYFGSWNPAYYTK